MTKVKAQLLALAVKRQDWMTACKIALQATTEGGGSVNLANAYDEVCKHLTPHQWAGYLSALERAGFYRPSQDPEYVGHWGYIVTVKE